jgi:Insertion element 4 transposase N-terminal/Transposase DDE domain
MPRGWLSPRGRVLARAGIGVLSWVIPPDLVDEAVGEGLAREVRLRALPSRFGVYFVLGLCLFSGLPYGQVLRELTGGLEGALAAAGWRVPATTALTAVRRRIGEAPLESLFRRLCSALSPGRSPWSHIGGLLAVAWDGTTVAAEASAENIAAFGKPGAPKRRPARRGAGADDGLAAAGDADHAAGCPQLRLVTLVACGTRALLDAAAGPLRGKGTGEQALARELLGSLHRGMLLLADRGFYGYHLWTAAAATGADLLWRAKDDLHLPVVRDLPDGSWLTHVNDPRAARARLEKNGTRRRRGSPLPPETGPLPGITIRVISFTLTVTTDDGAARTEPYRLLTTLTDWQAHPAAGLAACYAWRWAIETGYRECKTYLRGPGRRLRGRTPGLARQELWAYLALYQAIRILIVRAAAGAGLDPDRISFTAALHAIRRTLPAARASMDTALASLETEILTTLVPERHGRIYPRAVSKPISPYPSRRVRPGPISQHAQYTLTTTTPASRTTTSTHQDKHAAPPPSNPP